MSSSTLDRATETKRRFDAKKQSRAVDEAHARDTYGRRNPKPSRGSVNTGKYKSSGVEVALIVSASIDWGKRCPHFLAERLVSSGSLSRVLACAHITNGGVYGLISHLRRRHRVTCRRVHAGGCRNPRWERSRRAYLARPAGLKICFVLFCSGRGRCGARLARG